VIEARRFAVIGDPIAHSLSPAMHGAALAKLGLPHTYEAIRVREGELPATLDRLRRGELSGLNVTVPHKVAVMRLCDALTDEATATGAVNTVWIDADARLVGTNTDVEGLRTDLVAHGVSPRAALVLGAGGAARAAVLAASSLTSASGEATTVVIAARRDEAAAQLAASVGRARATAWRAIEAPPGGFDLIVNATSAGMAGTDDGAPLADVLDRAPLAEPRTAAVAYDLVYRPPTGLATTPFLAHAGALGLRPIDGVGMLVEQGARALSIFLRRPMDDSLREVRTVMLRAILAALGRAP
jgi:shikimate dehydrogenase